MRHFRVSIATLLMVVAACAVACSALRFASDAWAAASLALVLGLLAVAGGMALFRRGQKRGFWIGFAVSGSAYMLVCFSPSIGPRVRPQLPTTRMLDRLYPIVHSSRQESVTISRGMFDESFSSWASEHPSAQQVRLVIGAGDSSEAMIYWVTPSLLAFERV